MSIVLDSLEAGENPTKWGNGYGELIKTYLHIEKDKDLAFLSGLNEGYEIPKEYNFISTMETRNAVFSKDIGGIEFAMGCITFGTIQLYQQPIRVVTQENACPMLIMISKKDLRKISKVKNIKEELENVEEKKMKKEKTLLFVVDPQKGFTDLCPEELPVKDAETLGDEIRPLVKFAKYLGMSGDFHLPDADYFNYNIPLAKNGDYDFIWSKHCIVNTKCSEFIPNIFSEDNSISTVDIIVRKGNSTTHHPYGACYYDLKETDESTLLPFIKKHNIETVILAGLVLDYCVSATMYQLLRNGIKVILVLDATKSISINKRMEIVDEAVVKYSKLLTVVNNASELNNKLTTDNDKVFIGTSNVYLSRKIKMNPIGTQAHE